MTVDVQLRGPVRVPRSNLPHYQVVVQGVPHVGLLTSEPYEPHDAKLVQLATRRTLHQREFVISLGNGGSVAFSVSLVPGWFWPTFVAKDPQTMTEIIRGLLSYRTFFPESRSPRLELALSDRLPPRKTLRVECDGENILFGPPGVQTTLWRGRVLVRGMFPSAPDVVFESRRFSCTPDQIHNHSRAVQSSFEAKARVDVLDAVGGDLAGGYQVHILGLPPFMKPAMVIGLDRDRALHLAGEAEAELHQVRADLRRDPPEANRFDREPAFDS